MVAPPLPPARSDRAVMRWTKLEGLQSCDCLAVPTNFMEHLGLGILLPTKAHSQHRNPFVMSMASLSGVFSRGFGRKNAAVASPTCSPTTLPFSPIRGTYAYDILQRRFKELDADDSGCISEGELKFALKKLNLPVSEKHVQIFLDGVGGTSSTKKITFESFAEYAVHLEDELVNTFKEHDKKKTGYITPVAMKTSVEKYNFSFTDSEIEKMVNGFHARGGLSGVKEYNRFGHIFDFAEFREFLMILSFKDLRSPDKVWGRAMIDLGDADISFPLYSGSYFLRARQDKQKSRQKVLKHLISGVFSAIVSRTAVAPLECAKVLSMVGNSGLPKTGLLSTMVNLWREEGTTGLFRGNLFNVLRMAPIKILDYLLYCNSKEIILRKTGKTYLNGTECMLLGAAASMTSTLISHPLDTVRTALTARVAGTHLGMWECVRVILKNKGLPGFYRGIIPSMMRTFPYAVLNVIIYNELEQCHRKKRGPGRQLDPLPTICFAVLGGAASQIALYPLETIQRRLQAQSFHHSHVMYENVINGFRFIIQDEGLKALYAGILPSILKLVPAATISFIAYKSFETLLESEEFLAFQMRGFPRGNAIKE